jgi:hypothetical protein
MRRALDFDGRALTSGDDYDNAIRAYLALWLVAPTREEHYKTALERFGLDEGDTDFVDQVLCSAALGTLGNWATSHDDPWWTAGWRLSQSPERSLLNPLRWQIEEGR